MENVTIVSGTGVLIASVIDDVIEQLLLKKVRSKAGYIGKILNNFDFMDEL